MRALTNWLLAVGLFAAVTAPAWMWLLVEGR